MADVLQARKNQPPANFQSALRVLRRFAHSQGLVVAGPCRLVGSERTGYGESDELGEGPASHRLINKDLLFDGLWIPKFWKPQLEAVADTLIEMAEIDIEKSWGPESSRLPPFEDERGRWELRNARGYKTGIVVRTGEGSGKRYMLHLWDDRWYLNGGPPPYDLPVFGLKGLQQRPEAPVMIHEGPKAWMGAMAAAEPLVSPGRLANWMQLYAHIGWHGSDSGIEWTDWSVLKGRKVVIWPDMDEAGISNAILLAKRIARMGGVVEYVGWGAGDIAANEGWDWADEMKGRMLTSLTRYDVRMRMKKVETPFDSAGEVTEAWCRRSFFDPDKMEVYQESNGYKPVPLANFTSLYGKGATSKIAQSLARPFVGRAFLPGIPYGGLPDGRVNVCPQNAREPIRPAPLDGETYRQIVRRWLGQMVPDPMQRKHLLRKAAWAVARPHYVSQHMIILQGKSGIGKSVLMDLICRVAGEDRAGAVYPDSIFKSFNDSIKDKCLVCIHEIHSDDITRKQNASRLKELVGNAHITVREKYRSDQLKENVIHWFGATNERIPFALENGNDRFYFIRCSEAVDKVKMRRFFKVWLDRFKDQIFLDSLYAAAKWICAGMTAAGRDRIVGRARRQTIWSRMETASLRPWEQFLRDELLAIYDMELEEKDREDHPPVFMADEIILVVRREFPRIGPDDVRMKMNELGYRRLSRKSGGPVQARDRNGKRHVVWCRIADLDILMNRADGTPIKARSTLGLQKTVDTEDDPGAATG